MVSENGWRDYSGEDFGDAAVVAQWGGAYYDAEGRSSFKLSDLCGDSETVVLDLEPLRYAKWDESQHPRDQGGKFARVASAVSEFIRSPKTRAAIQGFLKSFIEGLIKERDRQTRTPPRKSSPRERRDKPEPKKTPQKGMDLEEGSGDDERSPVLPPQVPAVPPKLSDEQQSDILQRIKEGESVGEVAEDLGLPKDMIRDLVESSKPKSKIPPRMRETVEEIAGPDPDDQEAFFELLQDIYQEKKSSVDEYNGQLDEFYSQFAKDEGGKRLLGQLKVMAMRGDDATKIPGFDQAIDYAERYTPALLTAANSSDPESALIENLLQGRMKYPALDSDEVLGEALQFASKVYESVPPSEDKEEDAVPFQKRYQKWARQKLSRWRYVRRLASM